MVPEREVEIFGNYLDIFLGHLGNDFFLVFPLGCQCFFHRLVILKSGGGRCLVACPTQLNSTDFCNLKFWICQILKPGEGWCSQSGWRVMAITDVFDEEEEYEEEIEEREKIFFHFLGRGHFKREQLEKIATYVLAMA